MDEAEGSVKRARRPAPRMDPYPPASPLAADPVYAEEPFDEPPPRAWRERVDYAQWAFYGGLVGGVLILVAAFVAALFGPFLDATWEQAMLIGLWGLVTGGAVILAALRVKERPDAAAMPGLVMTAAGVLSFFALGGFFLGGLAAIVAGVLAVAGSRSVWRMPAPRVRDYA